MKTLTLKDGCGTRSKYCHLEWRKFNTHACADSYSIFFGDPVEIEVADDRIIITPTSMRCLIINDGGTRDGPSPKRWQKCFSVFSITLTLKSMAASLNIN